MAWKTCADCHGIGFLPTTASVSEGEFVRLHAEVCPECKGLGQHWARSALKRRLNPILYRLYCWSI